MKFVILIHHRFELWNVPDWFVPRLQREFPDVVFQHFTDYDVATPHLHDADAVMTWSLRPDQLAVANLLRWIHSPAAAVHLLMIPQIINSDIIVTNSSRVHAPTVAEHAMSLIMSLARRIPECVRYQQQHVWSQTPLWRDRPRPREVSGATLGIVGLGSIGTKVARMASALGMRILATREHPEKGMPDFLAARRIPAGESAKKSPEHAVYGPNEIDRLVEQSDYLLLSAPLRPNTQALIDRERLTRMKPDACIINVARGALIDTPALIEAIKERQIGGAALDVFDTEPLPPDSPLWDLPNVVITPHSGAITEKLWDRHYASLSENLRRFIAGEPLIGVVDKHEGY
jgi:phosphoglycerate dehydrogenase-like enzyme